MPWPLRGTAGSWGKLRQSKVQVKIHADWVGVRLRAEVQRNVIRSASPWLTHDPRTRVRLSLVPGDHMRVCRGCLKAQADHRTPARREEEVGLHLDDCPSGAPEGEPGHLAHGLLWPGRSPEVGRPLGAPGGGTGKGHHKGVHLWCNDGAEARIVALTKRAQRARAALQGSWIFPMPISDSPDPLQAHSHLPARLHSTREALRKAYTS